MVRFLFVFVLSVSLSGLCDGQPLSDHKISQEAARIEQRVLASIRYILPKLSTCDNTQAIEDTAKELTARVDSLERRVKKEQIDTCTRLFEWIDDSETVDVFEDRCYLFVRKPMTWSNAQERCQLEGANLVSVISKDLQDFIDNVSPVIKTSWIGARTTSTGNTFAWISNGVQLNTTYTNWFPGQPSGSAEDCVATQILEGWHDYSCGSLLYFTCEL